MEGKKILQKWQKDFEQFFDVYSTFLIDGYVDDFQPYISDPTQEVSSNDVMEVTISDYFKLLISENEYHGNRRLLVIYDPTEAVGRRFDIVSRFQEAIHEEGAEENTERPVYAEGTYPDSELANHFYEILRSDAIENQLIDHSYSGVSPDFAKIHYAITEEERIRDFEKVFTEFAQKLSEILTGESTQETSFVFVIKMLSRLKTTEDGKNLSNDELEIFRQLLAITSAISATQHKLIILSDKNNELPSWFSDEMQNYNVKLLHVSRPTDEYKEFFFDKLIENERFGAQFLAQYHEQCDILPTDSEEVRKEKEAARKRIIKKFLAYSNEFSMRQLTYYENFLDNEEHHIQDMEKLGYSLFNFRYGDMYNPWEDDARISEILNIKTRLQEKLKGQDDALEAVQQILRRSTIGLDRIDNPDAPRVILFLAGPTGTGKTEVCKQIADIIFGSPDRMIRFDMSEYGADESDQKLFGAPPGYVGYEEGGKLTNAILKEPFSLVLFDEIEKAHPSILDKFLQILSDGRLTSGKGETVSFTDSIIVITSNAGVSSVKVDGLTEELERQKMGMERPKTAVSIETVEVMEKENKTTGEIYEVVSNYLKYFVKFYFVCMLNRPELYGRVEDSIVYYNYVGKEAVSAICHAKIKSSTKSAVEKYQMKFNSEVLNKESEVFKAIVTQCQKGTVRAMGARGIGKETNKIFNGSLSKFISEYIIERRRNELVGLEVCCRLKASFLAKDEATRTLTEEDIEWYTL